MKLSNEILEKIQEFKNKLDKNGYWKDERTEIKGSIRKAFRKHPAAQIALYERRVELPPKIKADGTPAKRNQIFYRCEHCEKLFKAIDVAVDHIDPVVPVHINASELPFEEWLILIVRGVFCKRDNLQVLCKIPLKRLPKGQSSCHHKKTQEENYLRKKFKELKRKNYKVYKEKIDNGLDDMIKLWKKTYQGSKK